MGFQIEGEAYALLPSSLTIYLDLLSSEAHASPCLLYVHVWDSSKMKNMVEVNMELVM